VPYPRKNNKNINRASKNKTFATAHDSFGNSFTFKTAIFVPNEARDIWLKVTPRFPQRGNLARFAPHSPLRGTLPVRRSYGLLTINPSPWEKKRLRLANYYVHAENGLDSSFALLSFGEKPCPLSPHMGFSCHCPSPGEKSINWPADHSAVKAKSKGESAVSPLF
jgi:hypothetical protein